MVLGRSSCNSAWLLVKILHRIYITPLTGLDVGRVGLNVVSGNLDWISWYLIAKNSNNATFNTITIIPNVINPFFLVEFISTLYSIIE